MNYIEITDKTISFSTPVRIDMGGTLDISTFYVPLKRFNPSTFNIALDMRTIVRISPYEKGMVKISSRGFESAEFKADEAPFTHNMGMMFAIATHFGIEGVHIEIESNSPPKSGLGGSSVAAVAIVACFIRLLEPERPIDDNFKRLAALTAHKIEDSTLGVPCGTQDHLAASFGGINLWSFDIENLFIRNRLLDELAENAFSKNILVAYCGEPHESVDINGRWVRSFLKGEKRQNWFEICELTKDFADGLSKNDLKKAVECVNREVDLRIEMTPDVFDKTGEKFLNSARDMNCSLRFTGAGGGGCVWALGEEDDIKRLKEKWETIAGETEFAEILNCRPDSIGIKEIF